jgi:ABC-type transporter MlaC component
MSYFFMNMNMRSPAWIRLAAVLLLLLAAAMSGSATREAQAASCDAAAFVISAGKAYDQAARAGTVTAFANALSKYTDMRTTAMFALGKYRKQLPKARESEYLALTRKFMGEFMVEYGKGFRASSLSVVDCSGSASNMTVNARLESGGKVIFKLNRNGSSYLIRDMNIKSIWLVQQMRSTFVGTLNRAGGDFEELFEYLKS